MNQLQPNRVIQNLAIVLSIVSAAAVTQSVIYSATGLDLRGFSRIAIPLSLLCILLAENPRFKVTPARIPLLALGGVLGIFGLYFLILSKM
jgi:hypothetical protein